MRAGDIMTPGVLTVGRDTQIDTVVQLMLEHHIGGLPVVEYDELVGIVTESDLLRRPETGTELRRHRWLQLLRGTRAEADEYVHTHGMTAGEVMTTPVATVIEETPAEEIAGLLESRGIRRVPVLREGKLVGIVSRADLLRALASRLTGTPHESDAQIRAQLLDELTRHPSWAPARADVTVIVQDSVVHYWGYVRSAAQRAAMMVAAERIAGIRHVEDHTSIWHEPDPLARPNWPSPGPP